MRVSVVIPNWNGKEFLKACLKSLESQTFKNFEVIIVDNGSTDRSAQYIKKYFPKFKVIKLPKNIGFSPAVNIGIKDSQGEYIVLLNNDTKVDKDCLKQLVKCADVYPEVGMVAAKMLQFYNPDLIDSAGDFVDAVGHASNIGYGEKDGEKFNESKEIFLVTGGGALIKRKVFEKVGLLDDEYFAYFEDVDFCLRAQMQGFKAWFEPMAIISHIHKATSSRNKSFTEYLQFRNMTINIIKNFPNELFIKDFNLIKILLVNLNTTRFLIFKGYGLSALKAEWYIFKNFLRLLKKRKEVQSKFEVPKEYFINNIRPKKLTFFKILKKGI
ncbi:MAG: putative glycosyltransferase [Candidatus Daviesbacteria bacterium GW2011_GWA2_38_24]|uniref:Putative glycosyltransferase n=1 Tax=Candidatus Daviesbacteria bacterium GW2011_GWA2_38_24 TaxID=1618422 RepID=A0A0G0M0H9_9BACT|nr:MAG: putative glycosyltransferase [Candidatus Daviesbacteria bacterium GW2011_GWA2_38_24]KKQ79190.1 MAG: putative glycosyltransferase [Candidatus Daviesbacteria bacterium GW2011_GWA1_38_7]OGE23122.1 MAG: hypothetical protein A2688_03690 [Candidatus Daviesbacteria bacterium RIFCSPHIGHO2_01_FULL_38_8]